MASTTCASPYKAAKTKIGHSAPTKFYFPDRGQPVGQGIFEQEGLNMEQDGAVLGGR